MLIINKKTEEALSHHGAEILYHQGWKKPHQLLSLHMLSKCC